MQRIDKRVVVLRFLRDCSRERNTKAKKAFEAIESLKPRMLVDTLIESLTRALSAMPEIKIRAFDNDSELVFVNWAEQNLNPETKQRYFQQDTLNYHKYRAEVKEVLTDTLVAFAKTVRSA